MNNLLDCALSVSQINFIFITMIVQWQDDQGLKLMYERLQTQLS